MTSQELYQQAYTLHYKKKDLQNALNLYLHIIAQYPDTNEAKYASQQINNIDLDRIDMSKLDSECRNVLEEKEQKENQAKQAEQQKRDEYAKRLAEKEQREKQREERVRQVREHIYQVMVVSTPTMEGYKISQYLGFISGEVVIPAGILGAMTTGTFFLVDSVKKAKQEALDELKIKVAEVGGNAAIGVDLDISNLENFGILVSANGTAVVVEPINEET